MPTMDARILVLLCLIEVPILVALVWVLRKLLRTQIPDDQAWLVERGEKRVPYLPGEAYWRRPKDRVLQRLFVGAQEFAAVVPQIVVGSGLAVDVDLRFVASIAVDPMEPQMDLFDDARRNRVVINAMKPHMQRLVENTLRSHAASAPTRLGMGAFLHPLFGEQLTDILKRLHFHARQDLLRLGIVVTDQPLEVERLLLAPGVVEAYRTLMRRGLEDANRFEFVTQVKAITPGVSDQALVQLYHAVTEPSGPLHSILSSGVVPADMLVADRNTAVSLFGMPEGEQISLDSLAPKQDFRLTVEEMRLLKDLGS